MKNLNLLFQKLDVFLEQQIYFRKMQKQSSHYFNPEDAARNIFNQSFLKARDSKRQFGTGSQFFQDNRVRSCSYIKEGKSGIKAVPFYDKRNNSLFPTKSDFTKSWNATVHSNKGNLHAGMGSKKPLQPYDPKSTRNSMGIPSFLPPYRNTSHIQMGQRAKRDLKHYKTVYNNQLTGLNGRQQIPTSNPAIQAFRNKWLRSRLAM